MLLSMSVRRLGRLHVRWLSGRHYLAINRSSRTASTYTKVIVWRGGQKIFLGLYSSNQLDLVWHLHIKYYYQKSIQFTEAASIVCCV